jgi:hypothetical protein
MAKIALICQDVTPSVLNWAEGLAQQKHQVRILTSQKISWTGSSQIPIQLYFKKWSALEALRLLPSITRDLPDIFHFIFQNEDDMASRAHWTLASFAQSLRRGVASSLLTGPHQKWRWNPFLKVSHGVSFETRENLMIAKRSGFIRPDQKTKVILPMLKNSPTLSLEQWKDLPKILGKYLLIAGAPSPEKLELLTEALRDLNIHPVFAGPRLAPSLRTNSYSALSYTTIQENSMPVFSTLLPQSLGLLLCFHDFEPTELVQWHQLSLANHTPVWVRQDQLESLPGICRHGKTGFVIEPNARALRRTLEVSLPLWETPISESHSLEMADQSLNALNRFYSEISSS